MEKDKIINLLAENIRLQRLKNRMTQDELAEMCGLSTKYVNLIEAKKVNPSIVVVVNICQALKINLDKILQPLD